MWQFLVVVFGLSAALAGAVALVTWRDRRRAPAVAALAVSAATVAGWSLGDLALLLSHTEGAAYAATSFIVLMASSMPIAFFCVCLATADRIWRPTRRLVLLLAIEPVLAMAAVGTNPAHHLFFRSFELGIQGSLVPAFGPLFWAHCVYGYGLFVTGLFRPVRAWLGAPAGQRWVFGWVPAAVVPPLATNLVGMSMAGRSVDLTVVGFSFTLVAVYAVLVLTELPELVPVARRHVFDTMGDSVMVVDPSGRLLDVNPAGAALLRDLYPDLRADLAGTRLAWVSQGLVRPGRGDDDHLLVDANGRGVDLQVRATAMVDRRGGHAGWVLIVRDVTDEHRRRRQLEATNTELEARLRVIDGLRAELAEQALRDVLTGLHNRRYPLEVLDGEVGKASRQATPLSVVMIDIDRFKQINDRYGHGLGDAVLVQVGRLLCGEVRQSDVVARYGGEEFVLLLPDTSPEQARRRLDALRRRLAATTMHVDGQELTVTFSAGVAALDGSADPARLLAAADAALYEAKRRGRNRVEVS